MAEVKKIVAIDPGTIKSGACVLWRSKGGDILLQDHVFVKSRAKDHWLTRSEYIVEELVMFCIMKTPEIVVIEMPYVYGGGKGAAARNSNAIQKLGHMAGMIHGCLLQAGLCVQMITPQEWKGNLPKEATQKRVKKTFNVELEEDVMDAIGLGHFYLTDFSPSTSGIQTE